MGRSQWWAGCSLATDNLHHFRTLRAPAGRDRVRLRSGAQGHSEGTDTRSMGTGAEAQQDSGFGKHTSLPSRAPHRNVRQLPAWTPFKPQGILHRPGSPASPDGCAHFGLRRLLPGENSSGQQHSLCKGHCIVRTRVAEGKAGRTNRSLEGGLLCRGRPDSLSPEQQNPELFLFTTHLEPPPGYPNQAPRS